MVPEKKTDSGRNPGRKPGRKAALILAAVALLTAVGLYFLITYMIDRYETEKKSYSGAPADYSEQLLFDTDGLILLQGVTSHKKPDGTFSEEIVSEDGAITVRISRDFERPGMSCSDIAREKYPGLTSPANAAKDDQPDIVTGCVTFRVKEADGAERRHTAVLMRRSGWDYFADFSVGEDDDKSWDYIDTMIDHLFFM